MHLQENTLFDLEIGDTKHCPVPSTSCDLCTCKVWSCYVKWFCRRCIYKKIHYLTLTLWGQGHTQNVWSCYVQWFSRRYIYMKIHSLTFDIDLKQNIAQYPLHHCCVSSCYVQWFSRRYIYKKKILWHWPHTKCCPVPSTSLLRFKLLRPVV